MPNRYTANRACLLIISVVLLLQLVACGKTGVTPAKGLSAAEYREQAYHSIYQKRYADGAKLLQNAIAIALEPNSDDYLLLGDIQEALQQYKAARRWYQKGLATKPDTKSQQSFIYHLATLEAQEFNNLGKAFQLAQQLPENVPEALLLQALQAMENKHFNAALSLTEQVANSSATQEMKGWAHYYAAQAWLATGNQDKASGALFHAVNHARGHGLVDRITRLWEQLRQLPQQQAP